MEFGRFCQRCTNFFKKRQKSFVCFCFFHPVFNKSLDSAQTVMLNFLSAKIILFFSFSDTFFKFLENKILNDLYGNNAPSFHQAKLDQLCFSSGTAAVLLVFLFCFVLGIM